MIEAKYQRHFDEILRIARSEVSMGPSQRTVASSPAVFKHGFELKNEEHLGSDYHFEIDNLKDGYAIIAHFFEGGITEVANHFDSLISEGKLSFVPGQPIYLHYFKGLSGFRR